MQDREFLNALATVADELMSRAADYAGSDITEPCNLVLSNAATAVLIVLNVFNGRERSLMIEAPTTPRITGGVSCCPVLTQGAV